MASIETSLVQYLLGQTSVTSLVSTRIFTVNGPSGKPVYPLITLWFNTTNVKNLGGHAGVKSTRAELSVWSNNLYSDVMNIEQALFNLLEGFKGTMSGVTVVWSSYQGANDEPLPPPDSSASWIYRRVADYLIEWRG